jgi:hypothetical protein
LTYLQKDLNSNRKSSYKTLLPADLIEQKFAALFPHGWEWLTNRDGQWTTNTKYPLTPRDLIEKWRSPNEIIGVRFGKETSYLMLDIDAGSQYHPQHNEQALTAIRAAMESIGLVRHIAIQSSASQGLHLYFPLPYSINTFKLACATRHALEKAKLTIKDGTIEQFPNPKAFNAQFKGHRLPLQESSYILNDDLQPHSQTLETFLNLWDQAAIAQDLELLETAIAKAPKPRTYQTQPQGKGTEWRANIEARIAIGWTGKGQTNEMLYQIAVKHRVFDGIDDTNELAQAIATTAKNCQGFYEYSNHTREIESRALYTAQSVMITHYPYGSQASNQNNPTTKTSTKKKHQEKQPTAIERITKAIEQLSNLVFSKVREAIAAIRAIAKCSPTTLYKPEIKKLWQPLVKSCNTTSSDNFKPIEAEKTENQTAFPELKIITESLVTVKATNEVFLAESEEEKINQSNPIPSPEVSRFSNESLEPIQKKEYKPIMTFNQAIAIASTCPSPPMLENSKCYKPKELPRQNPSTVEKIQAIVNADPSKARSQLAMLKAKLLMPWLKAEERSQTEEAIAWLENYLDKSCLLDA